MSKMLRYLGFVMLQGQVCLKDLRKLCWKLFTGTPDDVIVMGGTFQEGLEPLKKVRWEL